MLFETVTSTIKNPKNQANKIDKDNFNYEKLLLKNIITIKNFTLKKNAENKNNPKELCQTLKTLGMPSKGGGNLHIH